MKHFPLLVALVTCAPPAVGDMPVLQRHEVVPIIFENALSISGSRRGDRVFAHVADGSCLPRGSHFFGRVISVREATSFRPAFMDIQFRWAELPDGERERITAVPISLHSHGIRRDRSGHLVANYDPQKQQRYAIGGAVGGLFIGGLVKRPIEGALIGALGGLVAANADRSGDGNTVVSRGQKMGLLMESDASWDGGPANMGRGNQDTSSPAGWRHRESTGYGDFSAPTTQTTTDAMAVPTDEAIQVRYQGRPVQFGDLATPFWSRGIAMLPVDRSAEEFRLDVTHRSDGRVTLRGPSRRLVLHVDSESYTLDGRVGTLHAPVVERGGVLFAPAAAFALVAPDAITLNDSPVRSNNR